MLVYEYDKKTKEYIGTNIAYIDPVATKRAQKDVYTLPVYTTEVKPPVTNKGEVAIFNKGKWTIEKDYRGTVVYNIHTREAVRWSTIGELPKEYATNLPERIEDVKNIYLQTMKSNFNTCLTKTKVNIPATNLYFAYDSVERLKNEQTLGIQMSRDDNNNIYTLTRQEYDAIINYMVIYGQYMYLQKWIVEGMIKNCDDLTLLKTYKNKLEFTVDQKFINKIAKMSVGDRKDYFTQMANNIK